jgi:hypothetical protein
MRAISSFNREAGMSTFWCRAWSAFRTRVSMSATGSVNLIVCFSSCHPFAPRFAENLRQLVYIFPALPERDAFCLAKDLGVPRDTLAVFASAIARDWHATELPRRLRNPWNFALQRELAEAQAANAELAQKCARPSAQLAAVVLARGELGLLRVLNSFCCSCQT